MRSIEVIASEVFEQNWREDEHGGYMLPNQKVYPNQWLWDTCATALGLRHIDPNAARSSIDRLLSAQWSNGMIPNMIFGDESISWHYPALWARPKTGAPKHLQTSGITQPPLIAEAVYKVGEKLQIDNKQNWFNIVIPKLVSYHNWLLSERTADNSSLVSLVHPWESGMDNSPVWDDFAKKALKKTAIFSTALQHLRHDTAKVGLNSDERSSGDESLNMGLLMQKLRLKGYKPKNALLIEDAGFNAIFVRANMYLLKLCEVSGNELSEGFTRRVYDHAEAYEDLWDEKTGMYSSRVTVTGERIPIKTVGSLLGLYATSGSVERAERLANHIAESLSFNLPYGIPSVALDEPTFQRSRFWRGPTWTITDSMIADGLEQYAIPNQEVREKIVKRVVQFGPYEYHDPLSGNGFGASNFSWTAANALDISYS